MRSSGDNKGIKENLKRTLIFLMFLTLMGCGTETESEDVISNPPPDFSVGDSFSLIADNGTPLMATIIDLDGDTIPDGVDLDKDASTLEFVFATSPEGSQSYRSTNVANPTNSLKNYHIDVNGDGVVDFYLRVLDFSTGEISLNTQEDGSGIDVTIFVNSSGIAIGVDTTGNGIQNLLIIPVMLLNDSTAPQPGNTGIVSVTDLLSSTLTLNWDPAIDDGTPSSFLQYKVVQSTSDNINTLGTADLTGDGRTIVMNWSFNITTITVNSLIPETNYYFTILTRDAAGNTAIYTAVQQTTLALVLTGSWTIVGGDAAGALNFNATGDARAASMAVSGTDLYAVWQEAQPNDYIEQIRAKKWDGINWVAIDGGDSGLNMDNANSAQTPQIATLNSTLYATWSESATVTNGTSYSTSKVIKVKEWQGGSSWRFIDGGGTSGLNKNITLNAATPQLAAHNSRLYAVWTEQEQMGTSSRAQAWVKEWDGSATWNFVDGGSNIGLNYDFNELASSPQLISFNSKLHAVWSETSPEANQIRMKEWDGTTWRFIDGSSDTGLNFRVDLPALNPHLAVLKDKLYVTWFEDYTTASQIRVKEWDGSNWRFIDGSSDVGLINDQNLYARLPRIAVFDSKLYITWSEADNVSVRVRIKEWNGSSWQFVDGGNTPSIVVNPENSYSDTVPQLIDFNSELYCIWEEGEDLKKIWVKKGVME